MSDLRRDLVKRRLWIVVVLLVAAVVSVPFLLRGQADAMVNVALPPASTGAATTPVTGSGSAEPTSQHATRRSTVPGAVQHAETTRNPFGAASPRTPKSNTTKPSAGTSTTRRKQSDSSTTAGVSGTLTPDPPASTETASSATATTNADPSTGQAPTTVTVTTTAPAITTTMSTTTTVPVTTAEPSGSGPWTYDAVDVRIGAPGHLVARTDLARLTTLPSVASPRAMFTGVLDHGHAAVFALGTGVLAADQGRCRPTHAECSAITLAPGQAEQLTWFGSDGSIVTEQLSVSRIVAHTTSSRAAALVAFDRHSRAGQCELDLADPVQYSATSGTLSENLKADCGRIQHAVPFPGPLNGS